MVKVQLVVRKRYTLTCHCKITKDCRDLVLAGYELTRKFLLNQYVYRRRDIPYATQIIPLAAICAYIGKSKFNDPITQQKLARWYWSGIWVKCMVEQTKLDMQMI